MRSFRPRSLAKYPLRSKAKGDRGWPIKNVIGWLNVESLARRIAVAAGVSTEDAAVLADSLVDADLHGISTHGISRLNIYIRRNPARADRSPRRAPRRTSSAGRALGRRRQRPGPAASDENPRAARRFGQAVRNGLGQHTPVTALWRLSYYCNWAAAQDMVLLAMTNGEPAMSPEGACEAFFGTNPIAVSFPTGKGFPIRIDMATSIVARGNVIAAQKAGRPIPEGWALDVEGLPTTDAAAALAGTVLAMAGHKGSALAMMVELFSGVLSGAAVGGEVGIHVQTPGSTAAGRAFLLPFPPRRLHGRGPTERPYRCPD